MCAQRKQCMVWVNVCEGKCVCEWVCLSESVSVCVHVWDRVWACVSVSEWAYVRICARERERECWWVSCVCVCVSISPRTPTVWHVLLWSSFGTLQLKRKQSCFLKRREALTFLACCVCNEVNVSWTFQSKGTKRKLVYIELSYHLLWLSSTEGAWYCKRASVAFWDVRSATVCNRRTIFFCLATVAEMKHFFKILNKVECD